MNCEYMLTGFRKCGQPASHIHTTVKPSKDGGTIIRYGRRCANHAQAEDKDIHTWTKERMAKFQALLTGIPTI